jgi:hypothetical protein
VSSLVFGRDSEPDGEPVRMAYVARCQRGHILIAQADSRDNAHRLFMDEVAQVLLDTPVTLERIESDAVRQGELCECERPFQEELFA